MTNNQLAENSVNQLLNSVRLARDNAERADNRIDHSFYHALTIALEELQERRKADSEPVAWMHNNNNIGIPAITASQEIGQYWMTEFKDVQPLYRHAQQPVVPEEMTIRDACKFVQDMRLFDDVSVIVMRTWNACRAAMLSGGKP